MDNGTVSGLVGLFVAILGMILTWHKDPRGRFAGMLFMMAAILYTIAQGAY